MAEDLTQDTELNEEQPVNETNPDANWYVVHTYSGYEKKVKDNIESTIKNRKLQDTILEVSIPLQEVVEINKKGQRVPVSRKLFPGYVLVHMVMNDETWYVVRNTRGVTGFVGPGSKPVPLTEKEMENLGINSETGKVTVEFAVGDTIIATAGAWENTVGAIRSINESKQTVTIMVDMFGRETPVELNFMEIRKM